MITPLLLAQLSAKIYDDATDWLHYLEIDGVIVGHAKDGDTDILVLRGSATAEDWLRDGNAIPAWHPDLGMVHTGFIVGMDAVFAQVQSLVGPKVAITGHSLGGARARILAAMFAYKKLPVEMLCVFGSPKPAFMNLARIISKSGMVHLSYRNRNDVVPTLPLTLPLLLDYEHTEQWTSVNAAPALDCLEPLRDHSSVLYVQALSQAQNKQPV